MFAPGTTVRWRKDYIQNNYDPQDWSSGLLWTATVLESDEDRIKVEDCDGEIRYVYSWNIEEA